MEAAATANIVHLTDVSFSWPNQTGSQPLLAIDHFSLSKQDTLFIHGASGSGKTTFLNLLAGVLLADKGKVEVLQQDYCQQSSAKRDRFRSDHIGFIFQQFNLLPYLSVIENVTLPCAFSKLRRQKILARNTTPEQEAMRLLKALGLSEDVGLRSVQHVSVGQSQRVAAARALMGSPELLIADEPMSSIDADNQQRFLQLLFSECKRAGITLVLVSHDMRLADLFDQRISMQDLNSAKRASTAINNEKVA